ncbi:MAG TPA: LCP family protein [Bacillota bacterium]|nr:LCP family protein [Bacillota bacterium]
MRKQQKGKWRIWKWIILLFFFFGVGLAGAVWWKLDHVLDQVTVENEPEVLSNKNEITKNYNHEPISFVLLGKDSRGDLSLLNTDVIIVAVLNPLTQHVTMMSIPRDTGVQIPGYKGWYKINSVYARGEEQRRQEEKKGESIDETGIHLMKRTLESAIGIPIQHYITVDFEGFERVIDQLGGISIQVDKSMKYDDPADGTHINLHPGMQVLNGQQALGYVRHRKDNRGPKYFSSDFDRGNRQQVVIKAIVDQMKSFIGISRFFGIMDVTKDHIRTDLSKDQIRGLLMDFKSTGSENITSIPSGGYWDPVSTHTIIPRKNVMNIQQAFRKEMGLDPVQAVSTFREEPAKEIPVKKSKTTEQEEEALKVQFEEKKNEQMNLEKAQPTKSVEKEPIKPKDIPKLPAQPTKPNQQSSPITPPKPSSEKQPTDTNNDEKILNQPGNIQPPTINPKLPMKEPIPNSNDG